MANELDGLDPVPETVTLSTGTVVVLEDLKARQFFKLLRIITRGALPMLQDASLFKLDSVDDAKEFAGRLVSMLLLSIPEAENEAIEFVQAMVKPAGLIERRGIKLNKQDAERNTELWTRVITDLDNPDLDDLVTIIEAIVKREADDLLALGKRLAAMFKLAEKTGQLKTQSNSNQSQNLTYREPNSSALSPESSTSYQWSTGGQTTSAATLVSVDFGSASQPSESGGSTSATNETSG